MTYFAKGKKCDLLELAAELGLSASSTDTVVDLRKIITQSAGYDESFVKEILQRIIDDRGKNEERKYELEKLRIQNGIKSENRVEELDRNSSVDIRNFIQKFDLKEGDIASFLILFERQCKRAGLKPKDFVSHLLGLLPLEITQLIARESELDANDYNYVKALLLKRFKLSPESFRQKFMCHIRDPKSTWIDYSFELRNFFDEWLAGLDINDLESLKELIVTDQLKKRVPNIMREHFIDSWPKIIKTSDLAEKLDEYENVRSGMKIFNENRGPNPILNLKNNTHYCGSKSRNSYRVGNNAGSSFHPNRNSYGGDHSGQLVKRKGFDYPVRNEDGEFRCFSCNEYGHIARNCLQSKVTPLSKRHERQGQRPGRFDAMRREETNHLSG